VGLKLLMQQFLTIQMPRSNRTIVGLKRADTIALCAVYHSSNRTIVGLKLF